MKNDTARPTGLNWYCWEQLALISEKSFIGSKPSKIQMH